jgi:hypothetical protein
MKEETLSIVRRKLIVVFVTFIVAFFATICQVDIAFASEAPESDIDRSICSNPPSALEMQLQEDLAKNAQYPWQKLLTYEGCAEEMGAWYMLPMPEKEEDRMQAVHAVLLPDNTVLIANGSSNRNRITAEGKVEDGVNTQNYDVVNNTSIFDPSLSDPYYKGGDPDFTTVPFTRIGSPPAVVYDEENGKNEANDLFCSGHLHLADGNVLFVGGSRFYYPGEQFQGVKVANFFNWQDQSWGTPELTADGHWYPTLLPLTNGAIAAFSGLSAGTFDVSTIVEIYDPNQAGTENEWQAIDIRALPNSPFNTPMNDKTYAPDYLDLYPRIFPVKNTTENKFLITGDGGGKVPLPAHVSSNSYFVTINEDENGKYSIEFEQGPTREGITTVYGTASLDPSSPNGDVLLYGGLIGTVDISFGPGKYPINGAAASSDMERWHAPENPDEPGSWELYPQYLSHIDEDLIQISDPESYPPEYAYIKEETNLGRYGKRAMNQAVILPSKQILMINGGFYAEHRPIFNATLMTPDESKPTGFSSKLMNPDIEARLYHNNALLLPDGRVLILGGNPSRAARKGDGTVLTNTRNDFEIVPPGNNFLSAEVYRHGIFYPPYLFAPGERPEITTDIEELHYGDRSFVQVANASQDPDNPGSLVLIKLGSATHSFDRGQRLEDLPLEFACLESGCYSPSSSTEETFSLEALPQVEELGEWTID